MKLLSMLQIAVFSLLIGCQSNMPSGPTVELQYWMFDENYNHDTHPDDKGFLVGRAGETGVESSVALAVKWEQYLTKDDAEGPYFSLNGGGLFVLGSGEEKRKNDNDWRPKGQHSEIYSRIDPAMGPMVGLDAGWAFAEIVQIGVSLDATLLRVDHGWNRFGSYDSVKREWKTFLMFGPEIRILQDDFSVFLGYGFGKASQATVGFHWRF